MSGDARAAKRAAKQVEMEHAAFLPDALYMLLREHVPSITLQEVRSMPSESAYKVRFREADEYLKQFGLALRRVTKDFMLKYGPQFNLLRTRGLYMVQMRVAYDCEDKSPELHCIAYDGVSLKGNGRCSKEIDERERSSYEDARKAFDSLFPGVESRVNNIYKLEKA